MRRHWFPYILTGLSLALAGIIALAVDWRNQAPVPMPEPAPTVSLEEYQATMRGIAAEYSATQNAERAYQAAILVRVPKEMLQTHLDLIIAWQQLAAGAADGTTRLDVLRLQAPWLQL
jgi:hypothetical protein